MLRLFEGIGVELEYMIVDRETLDVAPIADEALRLAAGEPAGGPPVSDVELGPITWSNELVLHVLEMKTTTPARSLGGLVEAFQSSIGRAGEVLRPLGARLMPGAMHLWMDPATQMHLWPHDSAEIYATFDRIFSCRGHGWCNLQSMHLNCPFDGDEEFGRLHAAIRLILPLLPGLAASSPIADGRVTGLLDTRLETYRHNSKRVPSVAGRVIPERAFTRAAYEREILGRIYTDLAPLDAGGILRDEWANARGCIARFGRGSIEIRVLDVQECPKADLAIAAAVEGVLRDLVSERWSSTSAQQAVEVAPLADLFEHAIREGEETPVNDRGYLDCFGLGAAVGAPIREVWSALVDRSVSSREELAWAVGGLRTILEEGSLARRMLATLGTPTPSREAMRALALRLCECLEQGTMLAR